MLPKDPVIRVGDEVEYPNPEGGEPIHCHVVEKSPDSDDVMLKNGKGKPFPAKGIHCRKIEMPTK